MDCDTLRVFAEEMAERDGIAYGIALLRLARENGIRITGRRDTELGATQCVRHTDGSIEEAHPWASRQVAMYATEAQGLSMQFPCSMNARFARIIADISDSMPSVNGLAAFELREACASIIHAMCVNGGER